MTEKQSSQQLNSLFDRGMISPRTARTYRNDWTTNTRVPSSPSENRPRSLRRRRSDLSSGEYSRQSSFNDSADFYEDSFPDLLSSLSQMSVDNHLKYGDSSKDFTFRGMTHVDDGIEDYDDDLDSEELEPVDVLEQQEEEMRMQILFASSSEPGSRRVSDEQTSNLAKTEYSLLSPTQTNGSFCDDRGVIVDSLNRDHQKVQHNPSKRVRMRVRVRSKGSLGGISGIL